MNQVISYQSPSGQTIDLTPAQRACFCRQGLWPRDFRGQEFCSVSHGLHEGDPTYSDAELAREFGVAS